MSIVNWFSNMYTAIHRARPARMLKCVFLIQTKHPELMAALTPEPPSPVFSLPSPTCPPGWGAGIYSACSELSPCSYSLTPSPQSHTPWAQVSCPLTPRALSSQSQWCWPSTSEPRSSVSLLPRLLILQDGTEQLRLPEKSLPCSFALTDKVCVSYPQTHHTCPCLSHNTRTSHFPSVDTSDDQDCGRLIPCLSPQAASTNSHVPNCIRTSLELQKSPGAQKILALHPYTPVRRLKHY